MVHWSYHWSPLEPTCSRPLRPTAPTQQAGFAGAVILVAGLDGQPQSVAAAAAAPARALRAHPDRASRASTSAPNASSSLRLIAWSPPSLSGLSRFGAETPLLPRCLQQFPCPQQVCLVLISLFLNLYPPDRRHRFYKCVFCLLPLAHRLCPRHPPVCPPTVLYFETSLVAFCQPASFLLLSSTSSLLSRPPPQRLRRKLTRLFSPHRRWSQTIKAVGPGQACHA